MSGTFDIFCAEASLGLAEPLAGTAARASLLVCVEDRNAWAPRNSPGPPPVDPTVRTNVPSSRKNLISPLLELPTTTVPPDKRVASTTRYNSCSGSPVAVPIDVTSPPTCHADPAVH